MGAGLLRQAVFVAEGLDMLSVSFSRRRETLHAVNVQHQASLSDGRPCPAEWEEDNTELY